jgi:hypothetical protein
MLLPPQHVSEPDRCFFIKVRAAPGPQRQTTTNRVSLSQDINFAFEEKVGKGVRFFMLPVAMAS